jgi:hypothetical protein
MKTLDIDDAAPQYKQASAIDAQSCHKKYWPTHSHTMQADALKLKQLAYDAFGACGSRIYLTARQKFITVKIDKPSVRAQWLYPAEIKAMHAFVVSAGIEPVATKRNLEFRIKK